MENNSTYRSNGILIVLVLILGLRIISYFTLFPDSLAMTQFVKVGLRLMLTASAFLLLKNLQENHREYRIKMQNMTPMLLYCGYLFLGLMSLLWTSLLYYSSLQLAMVVEALVFSWFFIQLVVYYNGISDNHARFSMLFGRATMFIGVVFLLGTLFNVEAFYRQTHGGEVSRLGGYIINPNELGMLAVLGAVMAYVELLDKKPRAINLFILATNTGVLLLTQSRSSLLAFLLMTAIYVLRTKNVKLVFFSIIAAVIAVPILIQTIIVKAGDLDEVMSMTGRLPFWRDLIVDGFTKEPLLGYGFMCISYHDYFDSIHAYSAKMAHNTFVQVLLNLGLAGAFIVVMQLVATVSAIVRSMDKTTKGLAIMMFIPLIINSITEFGIFGESNYGIQFYHFIILFFVFSVEWKPRKKPAFIRPPIFKQQTLTA